MRVLKYLVTGAIGLSVNLGVFRALYVLGVPYLAGSVAAFLVAMFVGFVLQKYWTFNDRAPERVRTQFMLYAMPGCFLAPNWFSMIDRRRCSLF